MFEPNCRKCHRRTFKCRTCKGTGKTNGLFGLASGPCSVCRGTGLLCPTHGKYWGG